MTRRNGWTLADTGVGHVVLTTESLDILVQGYRVGDLKDCQEQDEANPNSLVSLPDRIRSDGKND